MYGIDAVGNAGKPAAAPFQTDTQPPNVTRISYPAATQEHTINIDFQLDDGPFGSGVANVSCRLRATFVSANASNAGKPASSPAAGPVRQPSDNWQQECASPLTYGLQEGKYAFSIQATDKAGLRSQKDYAIVVDNTPPVASMVTGQFNAPQPPEVTMRFKGKDYPDGSPSGIAVFQCMLSRAAGGSSSAPAVAPSSSNSSNRNSDVTISGQPATTRIVQLNDSSSGAAAPASSVPAGAGKKLLSWQDADLSTDGADYSLGGGRRRLLARPSELGFKNGPTVPLATWVNCTGGEADPVTYVGLKNGQYSFMLRAMDAAGNMGAQTSSISFTVDESLLTPDEQAAKDEADRVRMRTIIIVVVCILGALTAAGVAVLVVFLRRRHLKRLREPPATMYVYNPVTHGSWRRSSGHSRAPPGYPSAAGSGDPALEAAMRASQVEAEEKARMEAAKAASLAEYHRSQRQSVRLAGTPPGSQHSTAGLMEHASREHLLQQQQHAAHYSAPPYPPTPVGWQQGAAQMSGMVPGQRQPEPPVTVTDVDEWRLQQAIQASLAEQEAQQQQQRQWRDSEPNAFRRALGQ